MSEMNIFDAERAEELVVSMTVCYDSEQIIGIQLEKGQLLNVYGEIYNRKSSVIHGKLTG